jgi:hypothetical protein
MVTSRTWALGSNGATTAHTEKDPGNELLWRANLRRLDVEAYRDSILAISGQLDVEPPANGSMLGDVFLGNEYGKTSSNRVNLEAEIAAFPHRTIYLPIVRNELPELLKLFDFADANAVTGARNARTIPSQALFLMNSPFVETQSKSAAERLIAAAPVDDTAALQLASQWVLGAPLSESARSKVERYLDDRRSELAGNGKLPDEAALEAWTDIFQTLFSGAEYRYLQ